MDEHTFIYLINSDIIIVSKEIAAEEHHHHAIKIAINLEDNSGIIFNKSEIKQNTLILNSDKSHSLDSRSNSIIILLINPESETGNHIRNKYLNHSDSSVINIKYNRHLTGHFHEISSNPQSKAMVLDMYSDIIEKVCGKPSGSFSMDDRIQKIFKEINKMEEKKLPAKDLASLAYLSESRFMHLFKQEVNIPVRQFLSWLRLLDAVKLLIRGETLTEAAMISGFTDLPHLHKTFTHFFGVKISDYFKNSRFIQVRDFSDV